MLIIELEGELKEMNLVEFYDKISSSDDKIAKNNRLFSEQVTMYNVVNGYFADEDLINIKIINQEEPTFAITLSTEIIASCAEDNLDQQIVPGAYKPLYRLNVTRNDSTLFVTMNEL